MSPHFREKLPGAVTLPQAFRTNGWVAARIGKLYHYGVPNNIGTAGLDDYPSWDLTINPRGRDRENHHKIFSLLPGQFGATLSWLADEGPDAEQTDGIAAHEAVRLLERFKRDNQPFFLAVGFYRPHTPYVAPKSYFDLYPMKAIELPQLSDDDRARRPALAYQSAFKEQDVMTDEQRRAAIQAYWASTSFMDAQVGQVLDTLDRLGLADSTIIVFTSDHGYHLADHGLWQKRSLFERSARVPLIIAVPRAKARGAAARGLAELVDSVSDACRARRHQARVAARRRQPRAAARQPVSVGQRRRVHADTERLCGADRPMALHRVGCRTGWRAALRHGTRFRRNDEPGARRPVCGDGRGPKRPTRRIPAMSDSECLRGKHRCYRIHADANKYAYAY